MKFDSVLAINDIAREIRDNAKAWHSEDLNIHFIVKQLQTIEAYLEPTNQPSVQEIIESPVNSQI